MPTYDEVLKAINDFYGDRARTQGETKALLGELQAEIDIMIESLDDD